MILRAKHRIGSLSNGRRHVDVLACPECGAAVPVTHIEVHEAFHAVAAPEVGRDICQRCGVAYDGYNPVIPRCDACLVAGAT